ncbi:MAG: PAS domain-containing protein, partial [Proteobacteria bacterium]|nr:PAS domain-containing protein [Pseudomonadota bacterium]
MRREEFKPAIWQSLTLLDGLRIGLAVERAGRLVWVNQRLCDMFGYAEHDVIGTDIRGAFRSADDYADVVMLHGRNGADTAAEATELALRGKDGGDVWCRIKGSPLDPADPEEGHLWLMTDVSDRIEAQQRARDIETKLNKTLTRHETIFRSLQAGVLLVKDRQVVWGNARFFDILGFAPEDLVGQGTRTYFISDEDYESIGRESYPALRAGHTYGKEVQFLRGDGRKIWCHIIGNAVDIDDFSEGFIWSFADITDRVEAEQKILDAQDKLARMLARQEAILRSMQVGV